jgi:hypothetical protein
MFEFLATPPSVKDGFIKGTSTQIAQNLGSRKKPFHGHSSISPVQTRNLFEWLVSFRFFRRRWRWYWVRLGWWRRAFLGIVNGNRANFDGAQIFLAIHWRTAMLVAKQVHQH